MLNHTSKYDGMCNVTHASKHGWIVMHLASSFISIWGAKVYECVVGSDSTKFFSCIVELSITLTFGRTQAAWECDDEDQCRHHSPLLSQMTCRRLPLCMVHWWCVAAVCKAFSFSSPVQRKRETLFRVNLGRFH